MFVLRKRHTRTDYSIKHIKIKDGDKEYFISFRDGLIHGVRVITLDGFSENAKITNTYPPLFGVIGDMLMQSDFQRLQRFGIYLANRFRNGSD